MINRLFKCRNVWSKTLNSRF